MALGHRVEPLPAFEVHKRVIGNKDDCADAARDLADRAVGMRRVPVKTVQQQADLTVHRVRSNWCASAPRQRELYEFGVMRPGRRLGLRALADNRAQIEAIANAALAANTLRQLDEHIEVLRSRVSRELANA